MGKRPALKTQQTQKPIGGTGEHGGLPFVPVGLSRLAHAVSGA